MARQRERIKVETFQAVSNIRGELVVKRGLQLVRESSGSQGFIDPARLDDGQKFGPVPQQHRKLRMDWHARPRKGFGNRTLNAFEINRRVLDNPDHTRRYRMYGTDEEGVGQAALISILNYDLDILEAQREANKDKRRVDLFKAGRRAGDPFVDVIFLGEEEEAYVPYRAGVNLAFLKALIYRPNGNPGGLVIDKFGSTYQGPRPERPDNPIDEGGGSDRKPLSPGPGVLSGAAAAEILFEHPRDVEAVADQT